MCLDDSVLVSEAWAALVTSKRAVIDGPGAAAGQVQTRDRDRVAIVDELSQLSQDVGGYEELPESD